MNGFLKMTALVVVLVLFLCMGVAHVINPDRFMGRSAVRKGGLLLNDWNRFGFQLVGALFAGFAAYLLYVVARSSIK